MLAAAARSRCRSPFSWNAAVARFLAPPEDMLSLRGPEGPVRLKTNTARPDSEQECLQTVDYLTGGRETSRTMRVPS